MNCWPKWLLPTNNAAYIIKKKKNPLYFLTFLNFSSKIIILISKNIALHYLHISYVHWYLIFDTVLNFDSNFYYLSIILFI